MTTARTYDYYVVSLFHMINKVALSELVEICKLSGLVHFQPARTYICLSQVFSWNTFGSNKIEISDLET